MGKGARASVSGTNVTWCGRRRLVAVIGGFGDAQQATSWAAASSMKQTECDQEAATQTTVQRSPLGLDHFSAGRTTLGALCSNVDERYVGHCGKDRHWRQQLPRLGTSHSANAPGRWKQPWQLLAEHAGHGNPTHVTSSKAQVFLGGQARREDVLVIESKVGV
jgi:hypothetical protein